MPAPDRPEVAVAGRSNCGKSTLINALTGRRKLARTSSTPGRTREILFFSFSGYGGPPLYLVDLPGYGYANVSRQMQADWGRFVSRYIDARSSLTLLLLLMDIRRPPQQEEVDLVAWAGQRGLPVQVVLTKADKLGRSQWRQAQMRAREALPGCSRVHVVSARVADTVEALRLAVAEQLTPAP